MVKTTRPLTPKQQAFCQEYLVDLNATQAAIRAGYSEKTADQQASRLLANVKVADAVQFAKDERAMRTKVDADYVIERLRTEAELTGEGASHSARVAALGQLGKHLGMFTQKLEHTVTRVASHIHKTDQQIIDDLRAIHERRRKRVENEAELEKLRMELEELRKLELRDPTPSN